MTLHRFVVPIGNVNTFCTFVDGQLRPENPLPAVGHGPQALDDEFGWVAWAADGGKAIGRAHLDATEGEGGFAPLPMPSGYTAACLRFHRQVLFVGGNCGQEVLGTFDFAAPEPRWAPLAVPPQFRQHGKRIDDLLLDGDRLIAVDDIVFPKYLLRYDVSDPRNPWLIDVADLPYHSSYERIHSAALGLDWVALFSTTANHGWRGIHIALLGRTELQERAVLSATTNPPFGGTDDVERRDWRGVAFHGNTLLVAAGRDGVGVLNLDQMGTGFGSRVRDAMRRFLGGAPEHGDFGQRCLRAIKYRPLPGAHAGRDVTRVVPVAGTRHCLAVTEAEPGFDTAVLELP